LQENKSSPIDILKLLKFYSADTLEDLIRIQHKRIEKMQEKLDKLNIFGERLG